MFKCLMENIMHLLGLMENCSMDTCLQKQFKMLVVWLMLHEDEAYAAWNKAVRGEHFDKIKPA